MKRKQINNRANKFNFSWYMQSQATTAGGKDKEAKNSIIQFYSFVVNGVIGSL